MKELLIFYKMNIKNNRGVSGIIATVIMIALVVVISGIVWVVVQNLVTEQLEGAGTCLDILDKVNINDRYTCYNSTSSEFQFAIGLEDLDVEKVLVSISGATLTKTYTISKDRTASSDELVFYNGTGEVYLPKLNEGFTYKLAIARPDSITIYPVLGGKQCGSTDSLTDISSCFLLE